MTAPDLVCQGDVRWFDFGEAAGSEPAGQRPVLVIQSDGLNHSRWSTTVVASLTSNIGLASLPGSVVLPPAATGLTRQSVVLLTALSTVNKTSLGPRVGMLPQMWWLETRRALIRMVDPDMSTF